MNNQQLYSLQISYLFAEMKNTLTCYQLLEESYADPKMSRIFQAIIQYHKQAKRKIEKESTYQVQFGNGSSSDPILSKLNMGRMDFPSSQKGLYRACFQADLQLLDMIKNILENIDRNSKLFPIFIDYEKAMRSYMGKLYRLPHLVAD